MITEGEVEVVHSMIMHDSDGPRVLFDWALPSFVPEMNVHSSIPKTLLAPKAAGLAPLLDYV